MSETREKILEAARDLYAEHGASALSMRRVAEVVGVSAPAIYRHFKDKEALVLAICEEGFRLFAAYLMRGLQGADAAERLSLTGLGYFDFAFEHTGYYRALFMSPHPDFERLKLESQGAFSPTFQFLVDRVAECQRVGHLGGADPLPVALTIWAHTHGIVALWLDGHIAAIAEPPQRRAFFLRYQDDLIRGLAPQPATAG